MSCAVLALYQSEFCIIVNSGLKSGVSYLCICSMCFLVSDIV